MVQIAAPVLVVGEKNGPEQPRRRAALDLHLFSRLRDVDSRCCLSRIPPSPLRKEKGPGVTLLLLPR